MIALYTETLSEFIENLTNIPSGQAAWDKIVEKFNKFPKFKIFTTEPQEIDLYDLFIEKYEIREIGAETEDLFYHFLSEKLDEILLIYGSKIQAYIDNFDKLTERKMVLERNDENTYYVNPVIPNNDAMLNSTAKYKTDRDTLLPLFNVTNSDLLRQALEIKDIYFDCLKAFEPCFMGVF